MFDKSRIVFINNIGLKQSAILLKAHSAFLHLFPDYLLIFEIVKFPKNGNKIKKKSRLITLYACQIKNRIYNTYQQY